MEIKHANLKERNLTVFADDMTVCIENPKECKKKNSLAIISKVGYKISI